MSANLAAGLIVFWLWLGWLALRWRFWLAGAIAHYMSLCQCGLTWRNCDGYATKRRSR